MDRTSTSPEELPPLELRPLRELELDRSSSPDGPAHLAAGSGVVRRGVYAYVIGDDQLGLGVFDLSSDRPGRLLPALSERASGDPQRGRDDKPDLEALTAIPPFESAPHGGLLGLGSGSRKSRDRGFFWALDGDGTLLGEPREVDFQPLYERLRSELGQINIEGACVFGSRLWLFHRANKGDAPNTVAEVPLPDLSETLSGDLEVDPAELSALRAYDLGELDGVELCFSDATPLFDELVCFTASAEADGDSKADGEIRGSVVGTIDAEGVVRRLRTIDRRWKVEGVHAALDTGVIDLVFVCDQDDPDTPSPLLTATMPLESRFERDDHGASA